MRGSSFVREMKPLNDAAQDPATDEAAAWLLRLRSAPDDAGLRAEFDVWLSRDPSHAEAWERAQQVWSLAGVVGPAPRRRTSVLTPASEGRLHGTSPRVGQNKKAARIWGFGLAVAASLSLVVVLFPLLQLQMQADYVSAVGEIRSIELADGSRVQLDSDSAIAIDYARDRRIVEILAGQAFFSVQNDRQRPFSVKADGVDVTVTGTEFEVRLASTDVSVGVAEGEVRVTRPQKVKYGETDATILIAGQGLRVHVPDGAVERMPVSLQSLASWRRGRLLIESATVGDLVQALRRYRSGAIVITDDTLAAKQVTGVFDLTDPLRALKTVVEPHAGRVREITPWLVIVSRI